MTGPGEQRPPTTVRVSVHEPLLGTRVQLRIGVPAGGSAPAEGDLDAVADAAEHAVLAEIRRLERVFSVHDPASELRRWRSGDDAAAGPELVALLADATAWFVLGHGAFHPATASATARWRRAEAEGESPTDDELAALAGALRALPFEVAGGRVRRTGSCAAVDLNAVAKGRIVDVAAARGLAVPGVRSIVVNAGGDLLHLGAGAVRVGIENPHRPFDNVPPLDRVVLAGRGLATSGSSRRGFRVGGRWLGHVIDPRTARPVEQVASATAVAPDAATADAAATILGVLPVDEALRVAARWSGVECLLVERDGTRHQSSGWASLRP